MRFGIRDITDVVFKARNDIKIGTQTFKTGAPVLYIDTAKTATLEGAATTVYAQGGHGNPRLVAWEGERTITLTVEDALLSPISFAMLTGAGLANVATAGNQNKVKVNTWFDLPIQEGGKVVIDLDTAGDNHDIYVDTNDFPVYGTILDNAGAPVIYCDYCQNFSGIEPNCHVYTITADKPLTLTFPEAARYVGKTLRVDCYVEKTGGVTKIDIDAKNFAGNYYVEAQTFFREEYSGEDMPVVLTFPNVKIQSNFTFNMNNSGDPSTFTFTMDAFPAYTKGDHTKKVFASIDMVAEENVYPDDIEDVEDNVCEDLDITFDAVTAGAKGWADQTFPGDTVKFTSLGTNLKATIDRANVDFSGNLKRIDNWTAFSSKPEDLTGYYYPFTMTAHKGDKFVRVTADGTEKTLVFGETGDTDTTMNMIFAVNPKAPVISCKLIRDTTEQGFSFDFSKVNFK